MKKILLALILISGLVSAQTTPDIEQVRTATIDSVTTPGYVLTTSTAGLPIWAVPPTAGQQTYWFYKSAADVGGYYYMKNTASTGGLQSFSNLAVTNGQLLVTHITEVGFPGLTFIPAGTITIHAYAEKPAGTKVLSLYTAIYKRTYPGGVETLLCTTGNSIPLITGAASGELIFTGTLPSGVILLISDRIVQKTYAYVSGTGSAPDVILYNEDATQSRIELPATTVSVNNFWGTQGNPISDSTINFLGTTNTAPLIFKTNNISRLKIGSAGNIYAYKIPDTVNMSGKKILVKNTITNKIETISTINLGATVSPSSGLIIGNSIEATYSGLKAVNSILITAQDSLIGNTCASQAVPGDNIVGQQTIFLADPNKATYDYVLVCIGINDIRSNPTDSVTVSLTKYQTLIDTIRFFNPTCKIIVMALTPAKQNFVNNFSAVNAALIYRHWLQFNTAVMGSGSNKILRVDYRTNKASDVLNDGIGNLRGAFMYNQIVDYIHPNDLGRGVIASSFREALNQLGMLRCNNADFIYRGADQNNANSTNVWFPSFYRTYYGKIDPNVSVGNYTFIPSTAFLGLGTATPSAGLDVSYGGTTNTASILIGANTASNTRTDSVSKFGYISGQHWKNSWYSVGLIGYNSTSTASNIFIGGASPAQGSATNIGMYTAPSNNGTAALRMSVLSSGLVGIGTAAPLSNLGVLGNLSIGATYGSIAAPTSGAIIEGTTGIGTSAPINLLDVYGATSAPSLSANNGIATIEASSTVQLQIGNTGSGAFPIWLQGKKSTNDGSTTFPIMINPLGGSVGIGTSVAASKLDVEGGISVGSTYSGTTAAPTNGMIIEGNVGIGTNSVTLAKCQINGTGNDQMLRVENLRTTGTNYGIFGYSYGVGGTENIGTQCYAAGATTNKSLVISSTTAGANNWSTYASGAAQNYFAGNVGIGITVPTGTLHVVSANTTGKASSSAFVYAANSLTTGTGSYTSSSTLTDGFLADFQLTGTAALTNQVGLNIASSGANSNTAQTIRGAKISVTKTNATSGTNIALELIASGATTANYPLITGTGNVGINTAAPSSTLEVTGNMEVGHIIGNTSAPSIAAGVGAGTTPTVTVSNATDLSGHINITTGTTPTGSNAIIATVTFASTYGVAPNVVISPVNGNAAALNGVTQVYTTSTTTTIVLTSGTTALTAATAYQWSYIVAQ